MGDIFISGELYYGMQNNTKVFILIYKHICYQLTLLMVRTEYSGFGVNTIPADAMAPTVVRASTDKVLAV